MQESFVGIHFGVDANPEIHVLTECPRDAEWPRAGPAWASPASPAAWRWQRGPGKTILLSVGLIYTRWRMVNPLISKIFVPGHLELMSRATAPHASKILTGGAASADVTYCAKLRLCLDRGSAMAIRTPIKFAGIRWHSDCSSYSQAARQRPHEIRTRRAETLLHKQASKRPMSPAASGASFGGSRLQPGARSARQIMHRPDGQRDRT